MATYTMKKGRTGEAMVITGSWDDTLTDVMQTRGIREIELNYAKGWKGKDLSFLKALTFLRGLSISAYGVENLATIHDLKDLRYLCLAIFEPRAKIDFTCFPHLRFCFVHCWAGSASILECRSLERVYLYEYKGKESSALRHLKNLKRLTISNGPLREVESFGDLENLEYLALYLLTRLESLRGIGELRRLTELDVEGCRKIRTLDEIAKIRSLRVLDISQNGKIESLKPIESLQNLENLYFTEDTIIEDGDMSVLRRLPKLNRLFFANRRHYSNKREEFWQNVHPKPPITMDRV